MFRIFGPPGTGKTEIAKIIGKTFSKLGVLSNDKFTKATRADLIAGYGGRNAALKLGANAATPPPEIKP